MKGRRSEPEGAGGADLTSEPEGAGEADLTSEPVNVVVLLHKETLP